MYHISSIRLGGPLFYAITICTIVSCGDTVRAADAPLPNVILIMADDLGFECLGAYGSKAYDTPNLDRLAREGMTFEHCYSAPICTASRVQIMTGKYLNRHYTGFARFPESHQSKTFGNLMKQAGYATCMAGKWQLTGTAAEMGFDHSLRCGSDHIGYWAKDHLWIDDKEIEPLEKPRYRPEVTCDFVIDFIEQHKHEPFFVYYPMFLVHHPEQPTPQSENLEAFLAETKAGARGGRIDRSPHIFPDMLAYMDKLVGRVVEKVDKAGLAERTLLLFTGDNGTCVHSTIIDGVRYPGRKGSFTDGGTHVPLIARWKGATPTGTRCKDLVDFTDFYATLSDLASGEVAAEIDGVSFLPQLRGRAGHPRQFAAMYYVEPLVDTLNVRRPRGYWTRTHRWKLYNDGGLINFEQDPFEQNPIWPEGDTVESAAARKRLEAEATRLGFSSAEVQFHTQRALQALEERGETSPSIRGGR